MILRRRVVSAVIDRADERTSFDKFFKVIFSHGQNVTLALRDVSVEIIETLIIANTIQFSQRRLDYSRDIPRGRSFILAIVVVEVYRKTGL